MASLPSLDKLAGSHFSVYDAYFYQADTKKSGIIGAIDAATFLKRSSLAEKVLGQIWEFSDPSGKGYLDKQGFFAALKLIAVAQSGLEVSAADIHKDALVPNLGPLPQGVDQEWDVPPAEKIKYDQIFDDLHPVNGFLSGDQVKPVLINSKLAVDVLGRVWDLSDHDKDGMLDREEFAVAMHLVYRALEKQPVPTALPPLLIPPSKRKKETLLPGAVPLPGMAGEPVLGPGSPIAWVVSPAEKCKFDEMFKKADTDKDGFVNGVEIKTTFLQSGLPQNVLAHIWNLCDTKSLGKLNSDQFALAMYFIQHKLKGTDPPEKLTTEMIPPSMRTPGLDLVTGPVADLSTAGMKELDMIQKEIDDIKREKMLLEQEKVQSEAEVKLRSCEVQTIQKELDVINGTVTKLEHQKGEAQKRLDELDDRKTKLNADVQDYKDKCEEEQRQIEKLRDLINHTESTAKSQESELKRMRDELNVLRRDESELEQKVEAGRLQLEQFSKTLTNTVAKISQTSAQVEDLQAVQPVLRDYTKQYQALIDGGDTLGTEPDLQALQALQTKAETTRMTPTQNGIGSVQINDKDAFGVSNGTVAGPDPFTEDPFKNDDPFKGKAAPPRPPCLAKGHHRGDPFKSDPFGGSDPFGEGSKSGQASKTDSFGGVFDNLDVLAGGSTTTTAAAKKPSKDPFLGDPFGGGFGSGFGSSGGSDPFAPFGGAKQIVSPVNPSDPFGTDPFNPDGKSRPPPPRPSKSPIPPSGRRSKSPAPPVPSLPPKQKKAPPPPRPPAPRPSSTKPLGEDTPTSSPMPPDDPFGGFDPFSGTAASSATKGKSLNVGGSGFADFSPSKFDAHAEADQLAWATRSSQDEWQRQKQLQEQEQRDLELAIKLSQQGSS